MRGPGARLGGDRADQLRAQPAAAGDDGASAAAGAGERMKTRAGNMRPEKELESRLGQLFLFPAQNEKKRNDIRNDNQERNVEVIYIATVVMHA